MLCPNTLSPASQAPAPHAETPSVRPPPSHFAPGMLLGCWWAACSLQIALDYSWRVTFFIASGQRFALGVVPFFPAVTSFRTLTCRPASAALTLVIQNVPPQQTLELCPEISQHNKLFPTADLYHITTLSPNNFSPSLYVDVQYCDYWL